MDARFVAAEAAYARYQEKVEVIQAKNLDQLTSRAACDEAHAEYRGEMAAINSLVQSENFAKNLRPVKEVSQPEPEPEPVIILPQPSISVRAQILIDKAFAETSDSARKVYLGQLIKLVGSSATLSLLTAEGMKRRGATN
jgi:hypothetical protein